MPQLFLIGGPNGAGKTTTANELLPGFLSCYEFVNADAIAAGLSPFRPAAVARQAGRLMLERLDILVAAGADFAFESTLASRSFAPFLTECRAREYSINLLYVWLNDPALAVERVAQRVAKGGHHVPEEIIRRRYQRGRDNLLELYIPLADSWTVADNSGERPVAVAGSGRNREREIYSEEIWQQFTEEKEE